MTDPTQIDSKAQYTSGFLANSFGLTLRQAREILDQAAGDRNAAAELARQLRDKQPL